MATQGVVASKEHYESFSTELGTKNIKLGEVTAGQHCLEVPSHEISRVLSFFKKHNAFPFRVLSNLCSVDHLDSLELHYHLVDVNRKECAQLAIKVILDDRSNPKIASVADIYPSADWLEREVFDMMGVHFSGHPDLRRLLCPDDWQGFPLRKDYMAAKTYQGLKIFPDDKMNFGERLFNHSQKQFVAREKADSVFDQWKNIRRARQKLSQFFKRGREHS